MPARGIPRRDSLEQAARRFVKASDLMAFPAADVDWAAQAESLTLRNVGVTGPGLMCSAGRASFLVEGVLPPFHFEGTGEAGVGARFYAGIEENCAFCTMFYRC